MMLKRALAAGLLLLLCVSLCGCRFFTADTAELLSPPELTGDMAPIAEAIAKSADGDYTLKYPSKGNYRSAVIQNDINGDGLMEAFAFYCITEEGTSVMCLNVICSENGKWHSAAKQKIVAADVDRVEFCDLDGDGIAEILVGWEIYGASEMQMAVYSFKNGELERRMLERYTHFLCCDLDEDGLNEIMIVLLNNDGKPNTATLYRLNDGGNTALSSVELDRTVKSANEPILGHLSSGRPAVYIDETKGVGAVTEVLFAEKERLVNPLFNSESGDTAATLRASSLTVSDINGDGIIEIPVQLEVPLYGEKTEEKQYLTEWCSYNGEVLTAQLCALMNRTDGWYYVIPAKLMGRLAVQKETESRVWKIYAYNAGAESTGELILTLKTVKTADWDGGYGAQGFTELAHDEVNTYLCAIAGSAADYGINAETVREGFKLSSLS